MLKAEQIQENYQRHISFIDKYISDDRAKKLKEMIADLGDEYVLAPASGKSWYHNAFGGGYVDHVNRVVMYAAKQSEMYRDMGGEVDYTKEELVFSALFHDLGKVGEKDKPSYLVQDDKWRQDKLHEMYKPNDKIEFMKVPDRSLFTLQNYGITLTKNEYLAIKLHDGVFDEANKAYFFSHRPESRQRTSIISVLHSADFLASKVEYDIWLRNKK